MVYIKTSFVITTLAIVGCSSIPQLNLDVSHEESSKNCFIIGVLSNQGKKPISGRVSYSVYVKDTQGNQLGKVPLHFNFKDLASQATVTDRGLDRGLSLLRKNGCTGVDSYSVEQHPYVSK